MQKFVALISTPAATMKHWMETTNEATMKEEMDTMMTQWNVWTAEHKDHIVDEGLPLGKTKRVTKEDVSDTTNDLNYMMVIQADDADAAAKMMQTNPHLQLIPDSYIEVMGAMGPEGM